MSENTGAQQAEPAAAGKLGRRSLWIGWLAAFSAPIVLLAGSWLFLFPAQLERGTDLVWALTLVAAAIAVLMAILAVVKRRWLAGLLLLLGTALLLGLGIIAYGISVLFYFGTDRSLSLFLTAVA